MWILAPVFCVACGDSTYLYLQARTLLARPLLCASCNRRTARLLDCAYPVSGASVVSTLLDFGEACLAYGIPVDQVQAADFSVRRL